MAELDQINQNRAEMLRQILYCHCCLGAESYSMKLPSYTSKYLSNHFLALIELQLLKMAELLYTKKLSIRN